MSYYTGNEIFWFQLYGIIILIVPSTMGLIVMFGLINVVRKMNEIRRSIESTLKPATSNHTSSSNDNDNDNPPNHHQNELQPSPKPPLEHQLTPDNNTAINTQWTDSVTLNVANPEQEDLHSDDPQKHGRARVNTLKRKSKQLSIVSVILLIYWIAVTFAAVQRIRDLKSPSNAGVLYQELLDLGGYWASLFTQFLALIILFSWVWLKIDCKNHRDNFTVCYLCCMGEPDPEARKQKSITNLMNKSPTNKQLIISINIPFQTDHDQNKSIFSQFSVILSIPNKIKFILRISMKIDKKMKFQSILHRNQPIFRYFMDYKQNKSILRLSIIKLHGNSVNFMLESAHFL